MTSWSDLGALLKGRRFITAAIAFLLVVPYTTGYIAFHYAIGEFPISPAAYLAVFAGLVSLHIFKVRPVFQWSHWLLLVLLLLRLGSAVVLGVDVAIDGTAYIFELGAALIFAVAICCLLGDKLDIQSVVFVCALSSVLINVGLNVIEWSNPGIYSNVPGRSAGWLENANGSAFSIVVMLALLLSLRLPVPLSIGLIGLSGVGVYFTLSRSGILVLTLTAACYVLNLIRTNRRQFIAAILCSLLAIAAAMYALDFQSEAGGDIAKRQGEVKELEVEGLQDADRMGLAAEALDAALSSPITGYGPGSAEGSFEPHNQLLAVWLDNGLLGLLLYLAALSALVYECAHSDKVYLIPCIPILAFIPFSHNMLESKEFLFAWILTAGLVRHERRSRVSAELISMEQATEPVEAHLIGGTRT